MDDRAMLPGPALVSVIMPAHRMGRFIGEALESVAAQVHGEWEVVVVDDHGPEDGTADIVRTFAGKHPDKRVELIRHPENRGVSAARNTAIAAARGEFLAFLDPDDLWLPEHLEALLSMLRSDANLDAAASPARVMWEEGGKWHTVDRNEKWVIMHFPRSLALRNFIQPSSTLVKRSAVTGIGGFDTDPTIQHIEDHDLWVRLVEAGHRFGFHPVPTAIYRQHGANVTMDQERMFRLNRRLMAKHPVFFREGREWMISRMAWEMQRMEGRMRDRLDRRFSGPLFRTLLRIDRKLGRWTWGKRGSGA